VVSNVATYLAQAGKQVLLVDLNLHRPTLARRFHLSAAAVGLTDLLARRSNPLCVERYIQATDLPGLSLLLAGTRKMSTGEFLQALTTTQLFSQLKQTSFDYVLFDAPPLLTVAETQILASSIETIMLVVDGSRTPRRVLSRTRQLLWRFQTTRMLGVVVNQSLWRDYADSDPYTLSQPTLESGEVQLRIEEVTLELPAVVTKLLPASLAESKLGESHLPDTGESERVNQSCSEPVIRPGLSLSGLTMSGNGLVRRVRSTNVMPSTPVTPEPFQHL
jgi:capsular exopolysaccharide synthesis family protein